MTNLMTGDRGATYKLKPKLFNKVVLRSDVLACPPEPSFGVYTIAK